MYKSLPRPTVFAHRGASAHAPENTLAAFELAVAQAAPALELDAKLCADQRVVVIHDQTVDRTTNGSGRVADLPLTALKTLDAGSHFDPAFRGEPIPTLDEVFETVGKKIFINVELTNYASPRDALPEKVAQIVQAHGMEARVLFSSFNPIALRRIHRLLPQAPLGLLATPGWSGIWARSPLGRIVPYTALHPAAGDVTPQMILAQHRRCRRLHAYTVNDPQQMARLFAWGIDGIFSDDPALALEQLSQPSRAAQ